MRPVIHLFWFLAIPLAFGEPLFLPATEEDRSRLSLDQMTALPLDRMVVLDKNDHAIPGSITVYRLNISALAKSNAVITIPRDSEREPLKIRNNGTAKVRYDAESQEFSGNLLHPNSDESTPIHLWLYAWRLKSLDERLFPNRTDQEFVYTVIGSIPIRWEQTILRIRPVSQSPDFVVVYEVEPEQTAHDLEEFNALARERLRKFTKLPK